MAVRKLRKNMKPIIWVITIAFFVSMLTVIVSNIRMGMGNQSYAFKINGEKVETLKVERTMTNLSGVYQQYFGANLDKELSNLIAFNQVIEKELTMQIAKKLKVKVPKKEINAEYDKIVNSINDKEQFKRMLQIQGYTKTTLKKEIEEGLLLEKTIAAIKEQYIPSEDELKEEYEENKYGTYLGKTYEEVKPELEAQLKDKKGIEKYSALLHEEKENMKLEAVDEEYVKYLEQPSLEKDGFVITNVDMANRTIRNLFATGGEVTQAEEMTKQSFETDIKIAKEAIKRGLSVEENLSTTDKLYGLRTKLEKDIKDSYKVSEDELKNFFEKNKLAYDTAASSDANIVEFKAEVSEKDKETALEKAKEILKEATPENFEELAIKYSEGPSGPKGGDLGWFEKGQMVKPFEDAVFKGESGKVYPEIVETQFGHHIIYVEEKEESKAKARHILITNKISDETKKLLKDEALSVVDKLQNKELTFEEVSKGGKNIVASKAYTGITEGGYIPELGYKIELAKEIFKSELNKFQFVESQGEIYVFQKIKEVKYKKADFEEVKDRVKYDLLNIKSQEELKKIIEN
ncbi:peptidylprolyl isomerase [Ilyobacter polytropus]|uniref:peptidylprolyl isomerase n=1 Tax=Ilyobacter polytropus (strain ATCC 51220 / DSM 2926 / LMG 16218 / CuHBu1) TaxID=572544 RepID=E3H8X9_ILYPC|nr:peptidylprolyl isomerase [Ilyobacter polytropus]ADO83533.1 PpiC-type peptidyl-prolyl cis-trans isomerase [Ilyobacter polytropus DSM 2926]